MSEFTCRHEINLFEIADEYAKRIEEQVDEMALDRAADILERFGYVKVIRCRDCVGFEETMDGYECQRFSGEYHMAVPNGFCDFAERREQ